jgi:hypothetical protein
VHGAVVNNDEETFDKRTADPVPNQIFTSKDQNGLNPLHKVTIKDDICAVLLPKNQTPQQFFCNFQTHMTKIGFFLCVRES